VMKVKFGFVKLRYRRLKKNAHQLFVICGLVNLFLSRQKLLTASAWMNDESRFDGRKHEIQMEG
jgi:hypothetical protein